MDHLDRTANLPQSRFELNRAARIGTGDNGRARLLNMSKLSLEQLLGHFWLRDVVNARAATAPVGFRHFNQFQSRNGAQ